MHNVCKLLLNNSLTDQDFDIFLNDHLINPIVKNVDEYGNLPIEFICQLPEKNILEIRVKNLIFPNYVKLVDIIIDDIRLGLVTFLCTTVDNKQDSQLNSPGTINIQFETPIWQWWCIKMNNFNYKDYPLGSTS